MPNYSFNLVCPIPADKAAKIDYILILYSSTDHIFLNKYEYSLLDWISEFSKWKDFLQYLQ